jgi:acyltransferase
MADVARRSVSIDAVRVVAMVCIVAGHVWVTDHPIRGLLYSWHVPVFFFLTGYLTRPGRRMGDEAQARARTLLVPYAAWMILLCGVTFGLALTAGRLSVERVVRVVWGGQFAAGPPFWPVWFVTALFVAALIYRGISRLPLAGQWGIAVVLAFLAVYVPGQPVKFLPWGIGLALPGVLFVVAGATLRELRLHVTRPVLASGAVLILAFTVVLLEFSRPLDMKRLDLGTPGLSIIVAMAISAGLILLSEGLLDTSGKQFSWVTPLAQASLVVLFLHPVVIIALRGFSVQKPAIFLLTLAITWPVGLVLLRLRQGWVLTGAPIRTTAYVRPGR